MSGAIIRVDTFKYGGHPHYSFPVRLVERTPELWIVRGEYDRLLTHHTRGIEFPVPNRSLEFFWPDRPYTVSAEYLADGTVKGYYCNVVLPPSLSGDRVTWVDLDLDLLVDADLSWRVVDEDEFTANAVKYGYPAAVMDLARGGLQAVIDLVEARAYPFDGSVGDLARSLRE